MEPGKTSFFQALGVPTKIARGTIEITTDLKLVEANTKVGASEATLLNMLNISPFTYGLAVMQVYDNGNTFPSEVLDITNDQLLKSIQGAIQAIACISLATGFPSLPSVIHSVVNSYKNVLAVAIGTEYSWPEIDELKDRIANPDAYASAAPAAAAATETKEEVKEEEEEESDEDGGFGGLLYVLSPSLIVVLGFGHALTSPFFTAIKCNDVNEGKWRLDGFALGRRNMWSTFSPPDMMDGLLRPKYNVMTQTRLLARTIRDVMCDSSSITILSFNNGKSRQSFFSVWHPRV